MSKRISDQTWAELSKLFKQGVSANRAARLCGVSEATARAYRDVEPELPRQCGCGRPLKHYGVCWARKKLAKKAAAQIMTVRRVDQSPLNKQRWCLTLSCGHEVWITSKSRPKRMKVPCVLEHSPEERQKQKQEGQP